MIIIEVTGIFLISILLTAMSEVFWHKFLFHNPHDRFSKRIAKLWNYEILSHQIHHTICKRLLEDKVRPIEGYWVQSPSNVFCAGVIGFGIQLMLLYFFGFFNTLSFVVSALSNIFTYTFWYFFEDHFHIAMHKRDYYEANIKNTWQDRWFKYCKRLHAIHHRDERYNLGFIFFPLGDLILGTYRHYYKK